MEYIEQVDKPRRCFLCRALDEDQKPERLVLWRNETSFALLNRWPYNNGHVLVAPVQHVGDLDCFTEGELLEQMRMLRRCRRNIKTVMDPDGFNVGLNIGRTAGAGLEDHLHWHIVPRWNGDTNFMPVCASTKVIPQSLHSLRELLKEADQQAD
jgi:ATP adenylyltransferase